MGFSLEFRVRSIFPLPLEGFSLKFGQMLISVRWCAEAKNHTVYRLNAEVKIKGHGVKFLILCCSIYSWIEPWTLGALIP